MTGILLEFEAENHFHLEKNARSIIRGFVLNFSSRQPARSTLLFRVASFM